MGETHRNQVRRAPRIAGGLLAMAVAAGLAYAVPSAEATPPGASARAPVQASGSAHHLSPRLALIASGQPASGRATSGSQLGLTTAGPGSILRTPSGRLVVDVRLASRDAATISAIEAAGARLLPQPDYGRLAVSVLPQDVAALAGVPGVLYVGEELTPQVNAVCDATISAGDGILRANQLRATGVDGTGVKVGVLSDSYDRATGVATNAAADIASDNLPGAANTCGHTSSSTISELGVSGNDEGRAMMQIVHDLAPGSPLDFATGYTSEASFAANITQLAAQGAKVIVDDVTYLDEPFYQDGIIEQAVSAARAQGVDYFSSAGNNRLVVEGFDVGSYEAVNGYRPTTCPAIPAITAGHTDCHNFGAAGAPDPTLDFLYSAGQVMRPIVQWAEPWDGGVHTDLDMYLVDNASNTVVGTSSIADNVASQQAIERFSGALLHNVFLSLVVARRSTPDASTPRFKIVWAGGGEQPMISAGWRFPAPGTGDVIGPTVFGHNGGADAMSVGAADVRVATNLDYYSSYGPVTTLFGPVNGATPAAPLATPRVVNKPDLVASDCNITTFFGSGNRFCGTSAAAPHAAAVAALLRQKFPTATVDSINRTMITTASRIAGTPASFQGGGLLNALAAGALLTPPAPPVAPDTLLTKSPKKSVSTTRNKAKVSFTFTSTVAGSTFMCSIDGKAFTPCASGVKYKVKRGKHTFAVRATAGGVTDATPASYKFKVKRKKKS